jgi:hypothetical protein
MWPIRDLDTQLGEKSAVQNAFKKRLPGLPEWELAGPANG